MTTPNESNPLTLRTILKCTECGKRTDVSGVENPTCEHCHTVYPGVETNESKTPRTDNRVYHSSSGSVVSVIFARQLETELTTLQNDVRRLLSECLSLGNEHSCPIEHVHLVNAAYELIRNNPSLKPE